MTITLDRRIHQALREAAHFAGLGEKDLAERAIVLYLESFHGCGDFEKELQAWQELGGMSLRVTEEHLGVTA
jgi:hypothetical protein